MNRSCKFCRILAGEIPAGMVLEDDLCAAFLDHRPLFPGHCLLVPKAHIETLPDLPDHLVQPLFTNARRLSRVVQEEMAADGTFVAINNRISQSVPHLHIHVVPRRKGDGLKGFFWPRHPYKDEQDLMETARRLKAAVERITGAR